MNDNLITSPSMFWFPGNIYHSLMETPELHSSNMNPYVFVGSLLVGLLIGAIIIIVFERSTR